MPSVVLFDGNSLTQSRGGVTAYPDLMDWGRIGVPSANVSVGGATTVEQDTRAVTVIDAVVRVGWMNWVVLWEGTNDLYFGATADDAFAHLVAYCQHRRAAGYRVMLLTLLPRADTGRPITHEANRQIVNARLRAEWATFADALVDVAADPCMGHVGQETDARFYLPDLVHLNWAGALTIAGHVAAALQKVL